MATLCIDPQGSPAETVADRLRLALDMMEMGISMKRMQLRRRYPRSSGEVERELLAWLEMARP